MALNPDNPDDLSRLRRAIRASRSATRRFRENRLTVIREFVGSHYSENGSDEKVPIPLLALAVRIFVRHLVARRPRVIAATQHPKLKPKAFGLQLDLNHLLKEIKLGQTLSGLALDGMFSVGFYKVGLDDQPLSGTYDDVGQPYCEREDLDNMVWDTAAERWDQCAYVGNRFRVPLEEIRNSKEYRNTGNLKATVRKGMDSESGEERLEHMTREVQLDPEDYEEYVDLWNVYLRRENLMTIFPFDGEGPALRTWKWTGPECGPYGIVGFGDVPTQIYPLAPAAHFLDLHTLANILFRKLGRQAERQKNVTGFRGSAAEDASRRKDASDGEVIQMNDPEGIVDHKVGGIDQSNLAFFMHIRQLFSWLAGNLDTLGGLSPLAGTLGQEQLLAGQSSKTVEELQDRMVEVTEDIVRTLAWFRWYDPAASRLMQYTYPGTDVQIPVLFSHDTPEGDFLDYNINIMPYSMQYRSPVQRLAMVRQIWQQDILPILPLLQQQGARANMEAYLRLVAQYSDLEEIEELVEFGSPGLAQQIGPVGGGEPRQSAVTRRENVRINRAEGNVMSTEKALMSSLLGGRQQPAEQALATTI